MALLLPVCSFICTYSIQNMTDKKKLKNFFDVLVFLRCHEYFPSGQAYYGVVKI